MGFDDEEEKKPQLKMDDLDFNFDNDIDDKEKEKGTGRFQMGETDNQKSANNSDNEEKKDNLNETGVFGKGTYNADTFRKTDESPTKEEEKQQNITPRQIVDDDPFAVAPVGMKPSHVIEEAKALDTVQA